MSVDISVQTDGAVVIGANAFESLANADQFFANNGSPVDWTGASTDDRTAALITGTTYVNSTWLYVGRISTDDTNRLQFPRTGAISKDLRDFSGIVPREIKEATCWAALYHLQDELYKAPDRGGMTTYERVGPLAVSYAAGAPGTRAFTFISNLIANLTQGMVSGARRLQRS